MANTSRSLEEFSQRTQAIAVSIEQGSIEILRKVFLAVDVAVVMATPVDTGRARANWLPSLNAPRFDSIEETDFERAMREARFTADSAGRGSILFLSNNLPYIGRLNDGWSEQAPAGFVQIAVREASNAVRQAQLNLDRPRG